MIDAKWIANHRALCEAATPGPWDHVVGGVNHRSTIAAEVVDQAGRQVMRTLDGYIDDGSVGAVTMTRGKYEREADNAKFIASARTAMPEALEEIERLRAEVQSMRLVVEAAQEISAQIEVHGDTYFHTRRKLSDALAALAGAGKGG